MDMKSNVVGVFIHRLSFRFELIPNIRRFYIMKKGRVERGKFNYSNNWPCGVEARVANASSLLRTSPVFMLRIHILKTPSVYKARIIGNPRSSHSFSIDAMCFGSHKSQYQTSSNYLVGSCKSLSFLDFGLSKAYEQLI